MTGIREKMSCSMSQEQEVEYTMVCAERILHYDVFLLLSVIGIQIFNLVYVLWYTKGKLHTVPSRVYAVLYVILLVISLAGLGAWDYLRQNLPAKAKMTVRMQRAYCCILLLWGSCVTIYDQRVSNNMNVFLGIALTVAVLAYLTPLQTVVIYGSVQIFLSLALPVFRGGGVATATEIMSIQWL